MIITGIQRLACWALVILVISHLLRQRGPVGEVIKTIDPFMVLVAGIVLFLYRMVNASVWGVILNGLQASVSHLEATRIWLRTESLRWLPGTQGLTERINLVQHLGLTRGLASFSLSVEFAIVILAWGLAMSAGLWFSGLLRIYLAAPLMALPATFIGGFFLLGSLWQARQHMPSLMSVRDWPLKVSNICKGSLATALVFHAALCIINGIGFYLLLQAFPEGKHAISLSAAIGINAAGWLAGFFAIGAPSGLGAREACLVVMLCPLMNFDTVALFVATWRLLQMLVEAVTLGTVVATRHFRPANDCELSPSA